MKISFPKIKLAAASLILIGMSVAGITMRSPAEEIIYGNGLLVTTTGKVVRGKISVLQNGYAVELSSGGSVAYPFYTIICEARSLQEAYRKQRDAMTRPTAEQHVNLAQWAFQQKLFAEAEKEIHSALNLQPNNHHARRLLEHFDSRKLDDSEFVDQNRKRTFEKIMIDREFSQGQPLGGLSPKLAKEFVASIEPLLINRCGNASCHGTSVAHDFRLQPKWNMKGNTRHISARNLKAVLEQIDMNRPDKSPLTTRLDGKHGKRNTNVFIGSRAQQHRQTLQNWTMRTGLYLQDQKKEEQTTFIQLIGHEQQMQQPGSPIQQAGFTRPQKKEPTILETTRNEQAIDPFNPEIFNQKMHKK